MEKAIKLVLLAAVLIVISTTLSISGVDNNATSKADKLAQITKEQNDQKQEKKASSGGNLPEFHSPFKIPDEQLSDENRANKQAAIIEYFVHVTESNRHQRNVFRWQLQSSKILFVIVLVLVIAGIYFAAMQFHKDQKTGKEGAASTIKFGQDGIEVSSSVLGVIILVISLAFFYLYLVYIFPIEFVK